MIVMEGYQKHGKAEKTRVVSERGRGGGGC